MFTTEAAVCCEVKGEREKCDLDIKCIMTYFKSRQVRINHNYGIGIVKTQLYLFATGDSRSCQQLHVEEISSRQQ
jgi:hypothetical protein